MRVDLVLPGESPQDDPRRLGDLATLAEDRGFGAVWLPDHLLPPGGHGDVYGGVHEPLVTLAHFAARTSTLRLGTSVLITPLREPILLAKQVATLDALAPGRVLLGVGTGWERSEFDALGADFATRGASTDDIVDAVRTMHRTGRGPGGGVMAPQPAAPVPIVIGGTSGAALRRAARRGDGWQALGLGPTQFNEARARLHALGGDQVASGARIAWGPHRELGDLLDEVDHWRRSAPEHLAIWIGGLDTAPERIARLGDALGLPAQTP